MKSHNWMIGLLVCAALLLAGCSSNAVIPNTGTQQAVETQVVPLVTQAGATVEAAIPPDVIVKIQNQVSELLAVPVENIQISKVEKQNWPDACLGLPKTGEQCAQAITAGWLVTFTVNGQEYRFRTNEDGSIVRQEP